MSQKPNGYHRKIYGQWKDNYGDFNMDDKMR